MDDVHRFVVSHSEKIGFRSPYSYCSFF